jgi:uncharacterized membrane protein YdjX (TVP38/TMEM64 family)
VMVGIPGSLLLTMLGGFLFGVFESVVLACVAATLGALGLITLVRSFFRPWARHRLGQGYQKWAAGFAQDDLFYVLFMRLMPVFPFWVVNLVVAVMEMPLVRFAPVSFVAMIPAAIAAALVGTGFDEALSGPALQLATCRQLGGIECAGQLAPPDLLQPDFLWAASIMALLALVPPVWRHYRNVQK